MGHNRDSFAVMDIEVMEGYLVYDNYDYSLDCGFCTVHDTPYLFTVSDTFWPKNSQKKHANSQGTKYSGLSYIKTH